MTEVVDHPASLGANVWSPFRAFQSLLAFYKLPKFLPLAILRWHRSHTLAEKKYMETNGSKNLRRQKNRRENNTIENIKNTNLAYWISLIKDCPS